MTVVPIETARWRLRPVMRGSASDGWWADETTELMRFYGLWSRRYGGTSYACGETESHEPQFYVLSPDSARPCLACVSRLWRNNRPWYVVEDGLGGLRSEGSDLALLVERERSGYHPLLSAPLWLVMPTFCRFLTDLPDIDGIGIIDGIGTRVEAALASQPGVISPEGILWWTWQVLALA